MPVNAVMIVPTGLGCTIGGHAGDATPAARLLASVCGTLVLHPNVVNASDINELPENSLYVEGSQLDSFLRGEITLRRSRTGNQILVVTNELEPVIVNGVHAAIMTLGISARVLALSRPLRMTGHFDANGAASGTVEGITSLLNDVLDLTFDALAVVTPIEVEKSVALQYAEHGGVNPWGGVEAMASAAIATRILKPVAHAPFISKGDPLETFGGVVDPRQAAEFVSRAYLFCIMKGLHYAPRITLDRTGFNANDIDVLVSPYGCWGRPHDACRDRGIRIVMVRENRCAVSTKPDGPHTVVANYLEAAGYLASMGARIHPDSVRFQESEVSGSRHNLDLN